MGWQSLVDSVQRARKTLFPIIFVERIYFHEEKYFFHDNNYFYK